MDLYSDSLSEKFLFLFENNFVLDFVLAFSTTTSISIIIYILYLNLVQAALYCFNILLYSSSQIIVYVVQTTNAFYHNSE